MSSQNSEPEGRPGTQRRAGVLTSIARTIRYRLLIPLFRSPHPPEYTARGIAVGVFWGFTPLVGVQTLIIASTWLLARRFDWRFSLLQGLAWSFVSNVFTMLPLYYVFYLTGMLVLGASQEAAGYEAFLALWQRETGEGRDPHIVRQIASSLRVLGVPTLLGCLPWAICGSWIAYVWSYRIAERRQRKRAERERAAAERRGVARTGR